ncbi:DUF2142 domain-containing protein [Mobiluncus porci]|uniref:DUF2142 domain-containing protein n=1 Tax=Mobiluncus porci TaxID=2652278 RepID=UPI0018A6BA36
MLLGVLAVFGSIVTALTWAAASPIGGSPDDDYHLASIWCPRPLDLSGCEVRETKGAVEVRVPAVIPSSTCAARQPETSAACVGQADAAGGLAWTDRVDQGDYPFGYYQIQHLFASDNVTGSILVMRTVNALLGFLLLGAVIFLAPRDSRLPFALAVAAAWVPMGVYLLASNNPSSWAISGVSAYAFALFGLLRSSGRRRLGLAILGGIGAVLAFSSRADASFYILVASLVILALTPTVLKQWRLLVFPAVASLLGLVVLATSGQNQAVGYVNPDSEVVAEMGFFKHALYLIMQLPEYFLGFWGVNFGPGWLDVRLDTITFFGSFFVLGVLAAFGLAEMWLGKIVALVLGFGALLGIPVVITFLQNDDELRYQPRYLLPLLALCVFTVIVGRKPWRERMNLLTLTVIALALALANAFALHRTIRRYITGDDVLDYVMNRTEWWWSFGPSPMVLWGMGSLGFLVAILAFLLLAKHLSEERLTTAHSIVPPESDASSGENVP